MSDVLYCGDTSLLGAASYLAGILSDAGWTFTYRASDQDADEALVNSSWKLCVLSDYPAKRMSSELQQTIVDRVQQGAGLLMIGGWESYRGLCGDWNDSIISRILPVDMDHKDDRVNCDGPVFVRPANKMHPILRGLPWDARPPLIGGYNRFRVRSGAVELLRIAKFSAEFAGDTPQLRAAGSDPLLVVDCVGRGRVAALATDVAPHWVGPWVDWGPNRVTAQGPSAEAVEVGNHYVQFFQQLIGWLLQTETAVSCSPFQNPLTGNCG